MNPEDIYIQENKKSVYSKKFDDIYFSVSGGLNEKHYVFVQGNELPMRWQNKVSDPFVIAETGFGVGLSFFATWSAWNKISTPGNLHYITIEQDLVPAEYIQQLGEWWPELTSYVKSFLSYYATLKSHQIITISLTDNIQFTWLHGVLDRMLEFVDVPVDAWYLDGFSPAKNPDMWTNALFETMKKNTTTQGTVATYTAASIVKKGLERAGFTMHKIPGYGYKREMLVGVREF